VSVEHEAAILSDLRRTHAQLKKVGDGTPRPTVPATWSMRLTVEEVDLLLAIVDERDDLKRRLVGDWEGDLSESGTPVLTEAERVTINTCPHAGTHHNCPLGGCPTFEPRKVIGREEREAPSRPRSAPTGPAARDAAYDAMRAQGITPERCSTCGDPCYRSGMNVWHWGMTSHDHGATL